MSLTREEAQDYLRRMTAFNQIEYDLPVEPVTEVELRTILALIGWWYDKYGEAGLLDFEIEEKRARSKRIQAALRRMAASS